MITSKKNLLWLSKQALSQASEKYEKKQVLVENYLKGEEAEMRKNERLLTQQKK